MQLLDEVQRRPIIFQLSSEDSCVHFFSQSCAYFQSNEAITPRLFITGAVISAESGVPTYRGIGGLYNVERIRTLTQNKRSLPPLGLTA